MTGFTNATLQAALGYSSRGWCVLPLGPGLKTPVTVTGYKEATSDTSQISHWFRDKRCNLGVATGLSGLVVIDTDGVVGNESLQELRLGRLWPETYTVQTRTPAGRHYYFRAPESRLIKCSAGKLGQGIDVRGQGGYVVAPPSWVAADHKGPAGSYRVLHDLPVANLPDWLALLLAQPVCSTTRRCAATKDLVTCQLPETPREVAILQDRLVYISADCSYDRYRNIIWAILSTGWQCAEKLALDWSLTAPHRFDQRTFDTLVQSYDSYRLGSPSYGTLVYISRQGGRRE